MKPRRTGNPCLWALLWPAGAGDGQKVRISPQSRHFIGSLAHHRKGLRKTVFFTGSQPDFCPFSEPNCPEKPGKLGNLDFLNIRDSTGVFKNSGCVSWEAWKIRRSALSKKGKSRAKDPTQNNLVNLSSG